MFAPLSRYHEERFRARVDRALETVRTILESTRRPRYAEDEDHTYDDKYALVESSTNAAIAASINSLERMGLDGSKFRRLRKFAKDDDRTVTMRFAAVETCSLAKEEDVEVESPRSSVVETAHHGHETKTGIGGDGGGADGGGAAAPRAIQKKSSGGFFRSKVVTKIREYHWDVGVNYELFAFAGPDPDAEDRRALLLSRRASSRIVTSGTEDPPIPKATVRDPIDVPMTWLLRNVSSADENGDDGDDDVVCGFAVDRSSPGCRTPRRNDDVRDAMRFFKHMEGWCHRVRGYFRDVVEKEILGKDRPSILTRTGRRPSLPMADLGAAHANGVFVPVLPLLEAKPSSELAGPSEGGGTIEGNTAAAPKDDGKEDSASPTGRDRESSRAALVSVPPTTGAGADPERRSPLLSSRDIEAFLSEQCRALDERIASLSISFPLEANADKLLTVQEASLVMLAQHLVSVSVHLEEGMEYVESMLHRQLVSAIGKEVGPSDFAEFVRFHNARLFKPEHAPRPFCHAVRRPEHYPEGVLSIESASNGDGGRGGGATPIETLARKFEGGPDAPPMYIPIDAATAVEFRGDRYLHGWVSHQFEDGGGDDASDSFNLVARTRQFSSFLLLVGTVTGPAGFRPRDAVVLQNKDEVVVPLLLNQLPTPKEFRDAIASLSPEQQRFARSFRSMQLESSVFGVCVVQLKPQLEVLLGLPADSLTKEIQLTQDLMSLFVEHQIPSDLLSFDGPSDSMAAEKVDVVKRHVKAVQDTIDAAKARQLEEEARIADMRAELDAQKAAAAAAAIPPPSGLFDHFAAAAGAPRVPGHFAQNAKSAKRGLDNVIPSAIQDFPDGILGEISSDAPPSPLPASVAEESMSVRMGSVAGPREGEPTSSDVRPPVPSTVFPDEGSVAVGGSVPDAAVIGTVDFTAVPKRLDAAFERHDEDSALRATVVETGDDWTKRSRKNLLAKSTSTTMTDEDRRTERDGAFDLLDALSRSGSLPVSRGELHVVVATTHRFDRSLIETVVRENVNPIEKFERSMLLIGSTIRDAPVEELLRDGSEVERVRGHSPGIFGGGTTAAPALESDGTTS